MSSESSVTYKLFLDDVRNPVHCVTYMNTRIGWKNPIYLQNDWVICRNFECFKNTLKDMGLPEFVSFDHDLGVAFKERVGEDGIIEAHFLGDKEETGLDCAKELVDYCMKHKLKLPEYAVHSMNPVGTRNIMEYLELAKKWL